MKMIIGGAYQGQLEWAKKHFPEIAPEQWVDGCVCEAAEVAYCKGIYHFHEYIRRLPEKERSELAARLIRCNPDIIIVSDEIGYGLVPVDAGDRSYREEVGRICTRLATYSEEVVRVVMGIGTRIKG